MNTLKTVAMLAALTGLLVIIGNMVGGQAGMLMAFGIAIVMNFGSYWFSDKIVLAMTRAQAVDRSQAPRLYDMVDRLSSRAGIPAPRLYIVPDPSPNAFATGRNPQHGVVAVNQGLLDLLTEAEVEGVVAHELAHIKHRDTLTMAIVATVAGAITMVAHFFRFAAIFGGGRSDGEGENPLVLLAMALVAPIAAMLIQMGVSRTREYEADRAAADFVGTGKGLKSALMKLERGVAAVPGHMPETAAHMCIVNPFGLLGGIAKLFSTHPSTSDRVAKLEEHEAELAGRALTIA